MRENEEEGDNGRGLRKGGEAGVGDWKLPPFSNFPPIRTKEDCGIAVPIGSIG